MPHRATPYRAGNTTPLEYDSLARQPLLHPHRGYYDIWDAHARTIHSQAREAAAAGFKAFMFYHYWFANGRTALTRPLEAALFQGGSSEPRRLGLSFFFSWANEAWEKRWNVKISERSPTAAPITLIEQVCCSCSKKYTPCAAQATAAVAHWGPNSPKDIVLAHWASSRRPLGH